MTNNLIPLGAACLLGAACMGATYYGDQWARKAQSAEFRANQCSYDLEEANDELREVEIKFEAYQDAIHHTN